MHPHTFLRSLLLMPVLLPLLAWGLVVALQYAGVRIVGEALGNAFVIMGSLLFGGVPYFFTAAFLWFRVGRCKSRKTAMKLIFIAPLVFVLVQVLATLFWLMVQLFQGASSLDVFEEGLMRGLIMAIYGLLFGYFYATFAAIIFFGAVRLGLVSDFTSIQPASAGTDAA